MRHKRNCVARKSDIRIYVAYGGDIKFVSHIIATEINFGKPATQVVVSQVVSQL